MTGLELLAMMGITKDILYMVGGMAVVGALLGSKASDPATTGGSYMHSSSKTFYVNINFSPTINIIAAPQTHNTLSIEEPKEDVKMIKKQYIPLLESNKINDAPILIKQNGKFVEVINRG